MSQTDETSENETTKQGEKAGEVPQAVVPPATASGTHSEKAQDPFHKSLAYLIALITRTLKAL